MNFIKKGQDDARHQRPMPRIDDYTSRQDYLKGRNGK